MRSAHIRVDANLKARVKARVEELKEDIGPQVNMTKITEGLLMEWLKNPGLTPNLADYGPIAER